MRSTDRSLVSSQRSLCSRPTSCSTRKKSPTRWPLFGIPWSQVALNIFSHIAPLRVHHRYPPAVSSLRCYIRCFGLGKSSYNSASRHLNMIIEGEGLFGSVDVKIDMEDFSVSSGEFGAQRSGSYQVVRTDFF